jgi:peptide/nickel transport system permease protein
MLEQPAKPFSKLSITHKDFPVTQVIVLLLSVIYILLTLASDIANAWLDPRIRVA